MSADAPNPDPIGRDADTTEPASGLFPAGDMPPLIGGRYRVRRVLGTGGMACVYLAQDAASGRELAVKRLTVQPSDKAFAQAQTLFMREFQTLSALSHPCVVEVYDYGVDALGPFYTMEHLEGGDLKERAPCGWREACVIAYDVCSVLALLHSRRFVHGDISPRNVRCTSAGRAKLIDFGTLCTMGRCDKIIGTPAFVAPEVVSRLTADARTDLYSLGGTLYYALTGQLPYRASDFPDLLRAWQTPPLPLSQRAPDVPKALEALVLTLLAQVPSERPSTTYEVMERLSVIGGLSAPDPQALAQACLSTPALVARDQPMAEFAHRLGRMLEGRGGGVLIVGASGAGRSRLLDEAVAVAKTHAAVVVRVGTTSAAAFGVVPALAARLLELFPELTAKLLAKRPILAPLAEALAAKNAPWTGTGSAEPLRVSRPALISALTEVLFAIAARQPLVVAVDDVQRLDYASISLLAALVAGAAGPTPRRLLVLATGERHPGQGSLALSLLASESQVIRLAPLTAGETDQLLGSMFGDVPNLSLLSARIHERALGNPRVTFDLLQYLVAQGRIVYARGGWTLPGVLSEVDLPLTGAAVLHARVSRLRPYGRQLLWAHALAPHACFGRDDYQLLLAVGPAQQREFDSALTELLTEQWLRHDGRLYTLAHRAVSAVALSTADSAELQQMHRGLAAYYVRCGGSFVLVAKHRAAAGEQASALSELLAGLAEIEDPEQLVSAAQGHATEAAHVLARALDAAVALGRTAREVMAVEQWLMMLSPAVDTAYYAKVGPSLRAKLERDSGWSLLLSDVEQPEAGQAAIRPQRLMRALMQAGAAHAAAPEQGLPPDQAIEWLTRYVAVSIAIGSKTQDGALLASLPPLLAPFAQLSPLVDALWQNALAVCESSLQCRYLQARARWRRVLERLPESTSQDLRYVRHIRHALAFAIGSVEVRVGLASASDWPDQLDADPLQAVNAMYLRKCLQLQVGDREGAEHYRKCAELLHLRGTAEQMFTSNLMLELMAHGLARDVRGIKQIWDRIVPLARRYPGWVAAERLAQAMFHQFIGEPQQAIDAYLASLREVDLIRDAGKAVVLTWPAACAGYLESLTDLGRLDEAVAYGQLVVAACEAREIDVAAHGVKRALALAEVMSGAGAVANARLQGLLDEQRKLGIKGIQLAVTYEARAKVALCMQDDAAYGEYMRLGAAEYQGMQSAMAAPGDSAWLTQTPQTSGSLPGAECFNTVQLRGAVRVPSRG